MSNSLPRRITISRLISGRYAAGERPIEWDRRSAGIEQIETSQGEELSLVSSGAQSTPAPGWELLLTSQEQGGFLWTLYGIKPT